MIQAIRSTEIIPFRNKYFESFIRQCHEIKWVTHLPIATVINDKNTIVLRRQRHFCQKQTFYLKKPSTWNCFACVKTFDIITMSKQLSCSNTYQKAHYHNLSFLNKAHVVCFRLYVGLIRTTANKEVKGKTVKIVSLRIKLASWCRIAQNSLYRFFD